MTPGSQTVTATDPSNSALIVTGTTDVGQPDAATHFTVLLPQNTVVGASLNGVVHPPPLPRLIRFPFWTTRPIVWLDIGP